MTDCDFALPFESVRGLLLALARERSLDPLLDLAVKRLAEHADVALARIWLIRQGDICDVCPLRGECPGQVPCLHLVASAGRSVAQPDTEWSALDGAFLTGLVVGGKSMVCPCRVDLREWNEYQRYIATHVKPPVNCIIDLVGIPRY